MVEEIELTCPVCGKLFTRIKSRYIREKTRNPEFVPCCSHSCARLNCKPRCWKPLSFKNFHGNFLFDQSKLDDSRLTKEKDLPCRCITCGKIFYISYTDYQCIYHNNINGINAGRYCSQKCFGEEYKTRYDEVLEKRNKTIVEKYGSVKNFSNLNSLKQKQTLLERYGTDTIAFIPNISKKKRTTKRKNGYSNLISTLKSKNVLIDMKYDDYVVSDTIQYKCLNCNHTWTSNTTDPQHVYCPKCYKQPYSRKEKELVDYVKSLYNGSIVENNRKILNGKELDIYLPSLNLAIEFNGNYWHSDAIIQSNKHVEKSLICKNKHIRLIHIFEYEWDYNKEKIKSLIKQALGLFDRVISSIDCVVRELEENEYVNFLIDNSIDKPINSFIRYGLFYCDELISVVGLDKLDKREYELKQYCTKLNYKVVDGLSTLLLKIKDFDKIVTFADFSKFDEREYLQNGFSVVEYTNPSFVYFNGSKIYQQSQVLDESKYMKIYDCGKVKLVLQ